MTQRAPEKAEPARRYSKGELKLDTRSRNRGDSKIKITIEWEGTTGSEWFR